MNEKVRWGILGCGSIARQFATALNSTDGVVLAAAGSRSLEKAQGFATEFRASNAHGSYEALASDPGVDVVYVATPHPFHAEDSLICLEHGKAVLCEKPFTLNATQARKVISAARERRLFLMEAMWTRFFPIMYRLRELLSEGAIGDVKLVSADFGFAAGFDPKSRLFDPALGGGALLDVGVYAVSFASMVLGKASDAAVLATKAPTGVDSQSGYLLSYPGGQLAVLYAAVTTATPLEATIMGTKGRIRVQSPFFRPSMMTLTDESGKNLEIEMPYEGNGYQFEIQEVGRCLAEGKLESAVMPLDESIAIVETLDELREQMGVRYPGD